MSVFKVFLKPSRWVPPIVLVISGCAVDKAGCDPAAMRDAGIFTRLSCDLSGSYGARAQDQQVQLTQAQERNLALQESLAGLESQNRELSQGLTVERAKRDRLVQSINQYLTQTEQQAGQNAALKAQVNKAREQLNQLASMPATASNAQQQAALARVQKEIESLRALAP
jgi:chromosome segregation ATPase